MRFTTITTRLCELSEELEALPAPTDELKQVAREVMGLVATGLFILESHDDASLKELTSFVTKSKYDLAQFAPVLGERDPAVGIVREMIALVSGETLPPRAEPLHHAEPDGGSGDMRDYRKASGGRLCRRCGVGGSRPRFLTLVAVLFVAPPLLWRLWLGGDPDVPSFTFGSPTRWAVVGLSVVFGAWALRGLKNT